MTKHKQTDSIPKIEKDLLFLQFYRSAMETALIQGQKTIEEKHERLTGKSISAKELNPLFVNEYPQFLRYSFVALLVALTETRLEEMCDQLGKRKKLPANQQYQAVKTSLKGDKPKSFFKKNVGDRNKEAVVTVWEPFTFLTIVRHCILHADGDVSKMKRQDQKDKLKKGNGNWPGYTITNNRLVFQREFCKYACKEVWVFLGQLQTTF